MSTPDEALLALHGGVPVRGQVLPYGHQSIDEDDIRAVVEVLRSGWITTGPKVDEFEEAFASRVGARHAVSFSSGTAALHGAVFAADLRSDDEAITSPLTFCATANCVLYQGGVPVFADVSPDTLNLDPDDVARRITPRTRVLVPVDYAGHPAELDVLRRLADKRGVLVIEDACHALGAECGAGWIGSVSHLTVFSFHPVKHITTGEGGMVTTNDPGLARRMKLFRNHGLDSDARTRQSAGTWRYEMVALGYNYRLTDIASALGLSQLRKLSANLARRRAVAVRYSAGLRSVSGLILPRVRTGVAPAWHLYPVRLELERLTGDRDEIFRALRAERLGVNVHYAPVHLHPYYRERFGYRGGEYPLAEAASAQLISLPMFHGMTEADVDDVIRGVTKVLLYYAR